MRLLDRAQETFTTTGTGPITFGGAPSGWRTFAAALLADYGLSGTIPSVLYYAVNEAEDIWEFGYGTVDTGAGTITRTLLASSTGALIAWATGTKYLFSTPEAILHSQHLTHFRGNTAPPHARAGYTWEDTAAGVTDVRFKIYDGADWIALFSLDETNNRRYPLDASGAKIGADQVDVASAATTDIGAAASDRVRITGTTTITGLGTVAAGVRRKVRFAASLTLTHHATQLILPGGQNITTAADDEFEFVSLGSGNWKCLGFLRVDGQEILATISPAQITADQNDYNPTGLNLATILRLSTDASRNLTGLTAPSPDRPKLVVFQNVGSFNIVLKHASASSAAANRFWCPNGVDFTLRTGEAVLLSRDAGATRWQLISLANPGVVQIVRDADTAVATGTGTIPSDDTIPQNTEGNEYLSATITPKSTANTLIISAVVHMAGPGGAARWVAALFKDSDADALAVGSNSQPNVANVPTQVQVKHQMLAPSTSAITFKVRAGSNLAQTNTFNGASAARLYGGVLVSELVILEVSPLP